MDRTGPMLLLAALLCAGCTPEGNAASGGGAAASGGGNSASGGGSGDGSGASGGGSGASGGGSSASGGGSGGGNSASGGGSGASGGGSASSGGGGFPADGGLPVLTKALTEHLGQLTGTAVNPLTNYGIVGTDLGAAFERDGKLVMVFGDSWTPGGVRQDQDSLAFTSATSVTSPGVVMPALTWVTRSDGQFANPALPGVNLGGMNVPVEGVPSGALTYLFFTTGYSAATGRHTSSVLAHMTGLDVPGLAVDHTVASDRFLNVSVVTQGTTAWIYGSGPYRSSPVYLARVPLAQLATRSAWEYLRSGTGPSAVFGPGESTATPVSPVACVGELSVRQHPGNGLFLMTYNCDQPRGIQLRWARHPAGPWSKQLTIFDPAKDVDHGYEHFIHANETVTGHDDGLSEPGRYAEWGGEYGPYLLPRFFGASKNGVHELIYALSSWNPYQVHLMRTVLVEPGATFTPPTPGAGLPKAALVNADFGAGLSGWSASGDAFAVFTGADGKPRVTTYVGPKNDAVVGRLWQDFTVDASTSELRFKVHGGDARVVLLQGNEVLRVSRGRRDNANETTVVWQLSQLRGRTLRLQIDDALTAPWGFVSVSGFTLQ
ncbi:MAG: DUF4185 domain-containing protein [Myxococcaceae bacterium]|nr:DUF4185 domain-containing protein [Myxococcaceae bacterium]